MAMINKLTGSGEKQETLRIIMIGSRRALQLAIHILHNRGFAHATDWCRLQPTKNKGEFITLLMRKM